MLGWLLEAAGFAVRLHCGFPATFVCFNNQAGAAISRPFQTLNSDANFQSPEP